MWLLVVKIRAPRAGEEVVAVNGVDVATMSRDGLYWWNRSGFVGDEI